MINLLPKPAFDHAAAEYRSRMVVVGAMLGGILCLIGIGLLAPTYFFLRTEQDVAHQKAAAAAKTVADPALAAASADVANTKVLLDALAEKSHAPRPSAIVELMLAVRPLRSRITQISYTTGKTVQITLSGTAATRDDLLGYKSALLAVPGVKSADFPAENLAASSTVAFSMRIQYTPPAPS